MTGIMLPVTLATAGLAALLNLWLGARIVRVRLRDKISIGDGGNPALAARMRAHLNFAEYTPIVLILMGGIELTHGTSLWLGLTGIVYLIGRVAHAFGMDGAMKARQFGTIATLTITGGLGIYAIAVSHMPPPAMIEMEAPAAVGAG
ncbi:MAPEG family protein [Sphingomonas japonica]|uniref:MAPEG family protein n=1 Tax=Sphingomonas japonica TaxID=511662 RepID=A0ABX0U074_9SPHN|nr:MAPEG family protein [Sphingomonas japonica]NIJ23975.1 hypothetical protein [Sphingomonas japonica]